MEGYVSEEQQIESIKKWWKENAKIVITGIVLGLLVLFGGKRWLEYKNSVTESASMEFEQLLTEMQQKNNQAVNERAEHIINDFAKTPYAPLAALALAKTKVEEGDNAAAHEKLQWVLDHAQQPEILHTARLRLAKIMIAQGNASQAITLLDSVDPGNFLAFYDEVKGDAYLAMKETAKAAESYKKALDMTSPGESSQQLQMKLDDLAPNKS